MPREFSRTRRVEEQLRRDLTELIRQVVKEPGLGMLNVAEVKVTPDLSQARVYISLLENDAETIDYTIEVLNRYAGKLRGQLGKRMHIRVVPQLDFIYDDLVQKSNELDHLIDQAVYTDKQKANQFGTQDDVALTDDKEEDQ